MTTPTGIDHDAPVIAHHEIDIAAPLDTVWNLHTDVDAWPAWNLEVTAAKLDGAFAPGNSFTWTSYDFTVTSTIYIVEDHSRTLWGGAAQGIMGTHEWRFAQSPAGVPVNADPHAGLPARAATGYASVDLLRAGPRRGDPPAVQGRRAVPGREGI